MGCTRLLVGKVSGQLLPIAICSGVARRTSSKEPRVVRRTTTLAQAFKE